jgi:predicted secreted hydrolase
VNKGSRRPVLALALAVPAALAGWARITVPLRFSFPTDHGSHPAFRTEWWYTTGLLTDADGHQLGFQLTFFRQGLDLSLPTRDSSALRARQVLAAHLAVADIGGGRVRFAERVGRIAGGLAGAGQDDLDVFLDSWEMRRLPDGAIVLGADDRERSMAVSLRLVPEKPLVLQGDAGISHKGPEPDNASAYVSYTRLAASGQLTLDGREHVVNGQAWFDHEWGTDQLGTGVVGWDWLGLRLGDGRELMVYRFRRSDGSEAAQSAGTIVERDGATRHLGVNDFTLEPLAWWRSPHSGARYPNRFRVRVASAGLDLEVRAVVVDAELDARASTGTVYWEGPVAVSGSVAGEGYAELTGYASAMSGLL